MNVPQILTSTSNPVRATSENTPTWKNSVKTAIRDGGTLLHHLGLDNTIKSSSGAAEQFPVFVTREFLSRMQPENPADPLLRQCLPISDELRIVDGFTADPLAERNAHRADGLLHKYLGRALLVTTGACAIHCRYCFRRHFPYDSVPHSLDAWMPAIDMLRADPTIHEVLLSGGDPLMLVDSVLKELVDAIESIDHIRRLRIHTRMPIVVPSRVTDELIEMLAGSRLTSWMVIHTNHANEIDQQVVQSIAKLIEHGIPVLNQAVLLRGVNDSLTALVDLCERLIDLRVTPYYLHRLDPVSGAAHFEVDEATGRDLITELRVRLPGYAVPRFVVEQSGKQSKTVLL